MQYLEKIDERNLDSKKVVGARVSEHVIAALNSAGDDINMFGYNFSISKVIEKALNNTLLEIKEKNGIDYYKLMKFQRKVEKLYDDIKLFLPEWEFDGSPDDDISVFKESFMNLYSINADSTLTFDSYLEQWEKDCIVAWNQHLKSNDSLQEIILKDGYYNIVMISPNADREETLNKMGFGSSDE